MKIPLGALCAAVLLVSTGARADDGGLSQLRRAAGGKNAGAPESVSGRTIVALPQKTWLSCKGAWGSQTPPEIVPFDQGGFVWKTANVGPAGYYYLCAADHWLHLGSSPTSVAWSKDMTELVVRADRKFYARVRAQDLAKAKSPAEIRSLAWIWADLSEDPAGLPSNPVEVVVEPKAGLGGAEVALALAGLKEAKLLPADSPFQERPMRAAAATWVDEALASGDGPTKVWVYTRETEYATASEEGSIRSGLEVDKVMPGQGANYRTSESALREMISSGRSSRH